MADPDPFLPPPSYRPQNVSVRRTDVADGYAQPFGTGGQGPQEDPAADEHRKAVLFQALVSLTPRPDVTRFLLAANIGVFVLMAIKGVSPMTPRTDQLLQWGANLGIVSLTGQWWRLFTATFLHIGILHLASNMYVLGAAGPLVERVLGRTGYAIAYVLSGLAGSMASAWLHPEVVSAGASGAIFGIFGALLGFVILRRDSLPASVLRGLIRYVVAFVGLNVVLGMSQQHIDMAAHVGGFIGGILCGMALSQPITQGVIQRRRIRNAALAVGGAVVLVGLGWALPKPTAASVANVTPAAETDLDTVLRQIVTIDQHRVAMLKATKGGEARADVLERDVIPAWRQVRARLAMLKTVDPSERSQAAALARFMDLQEQAWQAQVEAVRDEDTSDATGKYLAKLNRRSAQAWQEFKQIREEGE